MATHSRSSIVQSCGGTLAAMAVALVAFHSPAVAAVGAGAVPRAAAHLSSHGNKAAATPFADKVARHWRVPPQNPPEMLR